MKVSRAELKERLRRLNWTHILLLALLLSSLANLSKQNDIQKRLSDIDDSLVDVQNKVSDESRDIQSEVDDVKSAVESVEANQ